MITRRSPCLPTIEDLEILAPATLLLLLAAPLLLQGVLQPLREVLQLLQEVFPQTLRPEVLPLLPEARLLLQEDQTATLPLPAALTPSLHPAALTATLHRTAALEASPLRLRPASEPRRTPTPYPPTTGTASPAPAPATARPVADYTVPLVLMIPLVLPHPHRPTAMVPHRRQLPLTTTVHLQLLLPHQTTMGLHQLPQLLPRQ